MKNRKELKNPIYSLQSSNLWRFKFIKKMFYRNLKVIFNFGQKLGIHIVPNHFYYPIPDTRKLDNRILSRQTELVGININEEEQLELLDNFERNYKSEFNKFPRFKTNIPYQYYTTNGNFKSVDGEILYSIIRNFKPKKVIEIGSGFSTYCSAVAIRKNKEKDRNYNCELISIEPYPNDILRKGFPELSKLIQKKVQDVPIEIFKSLNENDILFIDSSHIVNVGNDVQYEFLEILPRLNKGVFIHVHDIFLPAEYPKYWYFKLFRFYSEQYILQAFLTYNDRFKIIWAGNFMKLKYQKKLEEVFDSLKQDFIELKTNDNIDWPSSFWIQKIK